jgi:hypothetical protein
MTHCWKPEHLAPTWVSRWRIVVAWLVLAGCAWSAPAAALTGTDVATLINRRYQSTAATCGVGKPAWYCSGVVIRGLPASDQFWTLTGDEQALQSVEFAYLRRDVDTDKLASSTGVIFADALTAIGWGKPYAVRCAYPVAVTPAAGTPNYGCNLTGQSLPPNQDAQDDSSCVGVGVSNASQWETRYRASGSDPNTQCSFSAESATQFSQSLEAHNRVMPPAAPGANGMLVAAWDPTRPAMLPVEAFFYDVNNGGQLTQAQRYQRAYFEATGQWVPILRAVLASGGASAFGYDERDQLDYGFKVANDLNKRYADTTPCPNGLAAYMCNGVMMRVATASTAFHAWNPSPNSIKTNGVSFTYMRADARSDIAWLGGAGMIMRAFGAPAQTPLVLRCIYPTDGFTVNRADRCGIHTSQLSRPCAEQGIYTLAAWQANFAKTGAEQACSLGADTAAFDLSIEARGTLPHPITRDVDKWNEPIVAPWPQDIPTQIPLEALFYSNGYLNSAQFIQQDYMEQTGRFLPIVHVDMSVTNPGPFSYLPTDQATAKAGSVRASD